MQTAAHMRPSFSRDTYQYFFIHGLLGELSTDIKRAIDYAIRHQWMFAEEDFEALHRNLVDVYRNIWLYVLIEYL